MLFFPPVQSVVYRDGVFTIPAVWHVSGASFSRLARDEMGRHFKIITATPTHLIFVKDNQLAIESYHLQISSTGIIIASSSASGAFYGVKTLLQVIQQSPDGKLPCLTIEDAPQLKVRGFMLDISRNKVPQEKTIKSLIDLLADLKYNHFELYVEGFSFEYPSFPHLFDGLTPLTIREYQHLEAYARRRCIDLVPCHNGLGHMSAWLARPEYQDLAAVPGGMHMWGSHRSASTLNPLDPRSMELVKRYYGDALKVSTSRYFHMNLDEPYELGHGKTKEEADKIGVGQLYLNYLTELAGFVHSHQRTPLVWGDVLNHYPETLEQLPQPMIFVDWGYDHNYPFHETLPRLAKAGVDFLAAPGTSSWNSFTGRTWDMFLNIHAAVTHTIANHGLGILLTDWGDAGHVQPLAVSYPAIVYAALEAWNPTPSTQRLVPLYINQFIAHDESHTIGQLLLDAGNYYHLESAFTHNGTALMQAYWNASSCAVAEDPLVAWTEAMKHCPYANDVTMSAFKLEIEQWKLRLQSIPLTNSTIRSVVRQVRLAIQVVEGLAGLIELALPHTPRKRQLLAQKNEYHWYKTIKTFQAEWLRANKVSQLNDTVQILQGMHTLADRLAETVVD